MDMLKNKRKMKRTKREKKKRQSSIVLAVSFVLPKGLDEKQEKELVRNKTKRHYSCFEQEIDRNNEHALQQIRRGVKVARKRKGFCGERKWGKEC